MSIDEKDAKISTGMAGMVTTHLNTTILSTIATGLTPMDSMRRGVKMTAAKNVGRRKGAKRSYMSASRPIGGKGNGMKKRPNIIGLSNPNKRSHRNNTQLTIFLFNL